MTWENILKSKDIKKNILKPSLKPVQIGTTKVKTNPLPEKEEEIKPKKEKPPPRCIEVYREIVKEIEDHIDLLVDIGKAFGLADWSGKTITGQTQAYNFSGMSHMHKSYDKSFKCPYLEVGEDKNTVIMPDYTYAAPDNISEKDACALLAILSKTTHDNGVELGMDYFRLSTIDTLGDMGFALYNLVDSMPTVSNIQLELYVGMPFKMVVDKDWMFQKPNTDMTVEKYEQELKGILPEITNSIVSVFIKIITIAKSWADSQDDLDSYLKKSVNPLGEITEYHGTMDIERVLKEGIKGNYTNKRSNKHIPEELRNVERITYTTESEEEALEFVKRRAKELGISESKIGVVGIRTKNLKDPVIHKDIRINAITFVREGGIPAENLERIE